MAHLGNGPFCVGDVSNSDPRSATPCHDGSQLASKPGEKRAPQDARYCRDPLAFLPISGRRSASLVATAMVTATMP